MFRLLMLLTVITLTGCSQPVAPLPVQPVAVPRPAPLSPEDSEVASFNARLAQLDLELAESSTGNDDNEVIKENLRRYAEAISDSADPILSAAAPPP